MNLPDQMQKNSFEITGFLTSAVSSSFVFSEFLERALEVAVFAFITGMVGAGAAHLYKIIVNKISKNNGPKETKS